MFRFWKVCWVRSTQLAMVVPCPGGFKRVLLSWCLMGVGGNLPLANFRSWLGRFSVHVGSHHPGYGQGPSPSLSVLQADFASHKFVDPCPGGCKSQVATEGSGAGIGVVFGPFRGPIKGACLRGHLRGDLLRGPLTGAPLRAPFKAAFKGAPFGGPL